MAADSRRKAIIAEAVRLLKTEREKLGISMNRLAEKSGLSQSLISTIENNPSNPTLDSLLRISEALNLNLGDILTAATNQAAKQNSGIDRADL